MARTAVTRTAVSRTMQSRTAATAKANRLLAFGDSLTAGSIGDGQLVDPLTDRWLDQLASYGDGDTLGSICGGSWTAVSAASSGGTSALASGIRANFMQYAARVDLVTIELGVNDGIASTDDPDAQAVLDAWTANITAIVTDILAIGRIPARNILIFGLPPQDNARAYGHIYAADDTRLSLMRWHEHTLAVATALGCTHIPLHDVYDPGVGQYNPDHELEGNYISSIDTSDTHPNAAGYAMWYEQVLRYLPNNILAHKLSRASV